VLLRQHEVSIRPEGRGVLQPRHQVTSTVRSGSLNPSRGTGGTATGRALLVLWRLGCLNPSRGTGGTATVDRNGGSRIRGRLNPSRGTGGTATVEVGFPSTPDEVSIRPEGRGVLQLRRTSDGKASNAVSIRPEGRGVLQRRSARPAPPAVRRLNPSRGTGGTATRRASRRYSRVRWSQSVPRDGGYCNLELS